MTIWVTSDTHYGHYNIIKYCNRPFKDVNHMNTALINNHNEVVSPEDTVFHLGDFSLSGAYIDIVKKLNGKQILIYGNHDKCFKCSKDHQKTKRYLDAGFAEVHEEYYLRYRGKLIWMAHIPPDYKDHRGRNYSRPVCTEDGVNIILHGHSHSSPENISRAKNVLDIGVDGHYYYPWSIDEVISYEK